jgi:hypothetical protein
MNPQTNHGGRCNLDFDPAFELAISARARQFGCKAEMDGWHDYEFG